MRITSFGFGSYNTALLMRNKIRVALGNVEFKQLIGCVEVHETYIARMQTSLARRFWRADNESKKAVSSIHSFRLCLSGQLPISLSSFTLLIIKERNIKPAASVTKNTMPFSAALSSSSFGAGAHAFGISLTATKTVFSPR